MGPPFLRVENNNSVKLLFEIKFTEVTCTTERNHNLQRKCLDIYSRLGKSFHRFSIISCTCTSLFSLLFNTLPVDLFSVFLNLVKNSLACLIKVHVHTCTYTLHVACTCRISACTCSSVQHTVWLTNRLHLAMRVFSNRSQMTSKCDKSKKVAHEEITKYVTDVLTTFWLLWWSRSTTKQTHSNMESICFV